MKKTLLLITAIVALSITANAQVGLTNLNFENWTNNEPNGFTGFGITQHTVGAQSGASYAKITSSVTANPIPDGVMTLMSINGASVYGIGAPYTQKPTFIKGYIRTNIVGTDTVFISCVFKKNGSVLGGVLMAPITVSIPSWYQISLDISLITGFNQNPDTALLEFAANRYYVNNPTYNNNKMGNNGTYLEVDNFQYITSTNITDFSDYNYLSNYPNPANNELFIETSLQDVNYVEIYDTNGKLVETKELNAKIRVDLNNYSNGLYFTKLYNKHHQLLKTNKFTVTK